MLKSSSDTQSPMSIIVKTCLNQFLVRTDISFGQKTVMYSALPKIEGSLITQDA